VFDASGLSITCNQIAYDSVVKGTASGGLGFQAEAITVEPTYDKCTFLGAEVAVK